MWERCIGECPICGKDNLNYDKVIKEGDDGSYYYGFICNDCGFKGKEVYEIEYLATTEE